MTHEIFNINGPVPAQSYSAALFDALLKTSSDCILATDDEGRLLFLSDAAARVLGTSPQDALGRTLADLEPIATEIVALFDRCRHTVLRTGQPVTEMCSVEVQGSLQHFEATCSPV